MVNSILWGNAAGNGSRGDEVYLGLIYYVPSSGSSIDISYSDIDPALIIAGTPTLSENINSDPLFLDQRPASEAPTIAGDYHLTSVSPCIDAGTAIGAPSDDIDGNSRPQGSGYDMGSDEFVGTPTCTDADGDGYYAKSGCGTAVDCDDSNASIHPGATETCNGIDDNCDRSSDEGLTTTYYQDSDGDSYGNATVTQDACSMPTGYVIDNTDCNDGDVYVNPGVSEICNGKDDNCDGSSDEGLATTTYYQDYDGDGYGNSSVTQNACSSPSGYVWV